MAKLYVFVCDNYSLEFGKALDSEEFKDVNVVSYPCASMDKKIKMQLENLLHEAHVAQGDGIVICGDDCELLSLIPKEIYFKVCRSGYCFWHYSNEKLLAYVVESGGYIIGSGWLQNWRERLAEAGFDRETARLFYGETCRQLVFFNAGVVENFKANLEELSEYLGLPFVVIDHDLNYLKILLKSLVSEWRLQNKIEEQSNELRNLQMQSAEYSSILDLIGKLTSYNTRRDTIEKIKEIFISMFGAQKFYFWNSSIGTIDLPDRISKLIFDSGSNYIFEENENIFCFKIVNNGKLYGVFEVGDFLYPQYIEKCLNFALEIAKVCGLVLSNIEQYEKLATSEQEFKYLSFHDPLTGLYNRTFLNESLELNKDEKHLAVFVFDIDNLKYVNDNFGHAAGDDLISKVANILQACFRESDVLARVGGDEFIAILHQCDIEMAESFKKRILESIENQNLKEKREHMKIKISFGFAATEEQTNSVEELIKKADVLMYRDKASHREVVKEDK